MMTLVVPSPTSSSCVRLSWIIDCSSEQAAAAAAAAAACVAIQVKQLTYQLQQ
jgi:hypothetical protein